MSYQIRLATTNDLDDVVGLRLHAEEWLHKAGIDQWTVTSRGVENIHAGIARDKTCVIEHHGSIIGSVTLNGPDLDFWSEKDAPDDGLYLYKFMIHSDHRGSGLGDAVLDWACQKTEDVGRQWLRIDVWKANTRLHQYYQRRGFEYVRTVNVLNRNSGALFQRPAHLRFAVPGRVAIEDSTTLGSIAPHQQKLGNTPIGEGAEEVDVRNTS